MEAVKGSSSKWINENHLARGKFNWQKGYGAFSYSKSQLPALIEYVHNQKMHHKEKLFIDEYVETLENLELIMIENIFFLIQIIFDGSVAPTALGIHSCFKSTKPSATLSLSVAPMALGVNRAFSTEPPELCPSIKEQ